MAMKMFHLPEHFKGSPLIIDCNPGQLGAPNVPFKNATERSLVTLTSTTTSCSGCTITTTKQTFLIPVDIFLLRQYFVNTQSDGQQTPVIEWDHWIKYCQTITDDLWSSISTSSGSRCIFKSYADFIDRGIQAVVFEIPRPYAVADTMSDARNTDVHTTKAFASLTSHNVEYPSSRSPSPFSSYETRVVNFPVGSHDHLGMADDALLVVRNTDDWNLPWEYVVPLLFNVPDVDSFHGSRIDVYSF